MAIEIKFEDQDALIDDLLNDLYPRTLKSMLVNLDKKGYDTVEHGFILSLFASLFMTGVNNFLIKDKDLSCEQKINIFGSMQMELSMKFADHLEPKDAAI